MASIPLRTLPARLRARFRPPRRLRMQTGGVVLIIGVFALGIAALNTGNNLLYLLVGALLGLIALSGWLSEQSISGILVERHTPYAVTAGQPARIEYRVRNRKHRLPSVSLELRDALATGSGVPRQPNAETAYLPIVAAGETASVTTRITIPRRGVYRLERLVASTAYPFGFFIKQRDLRVAGTMVVWPRTDRPVRSPAPASGRGVRRQAGAVGAAGAERGDYRALRAYRPGDDPRDIHWRSSARRSEPVVREYDRASADTWWIVLDTCTSGDEDLDEVAIELAASLGALAAKRGDRFGFAAGTVRLPPIAAAGQLEAMLDVLARISFDGKARLSLPAPAAECVLVTALAATGYGYADILSAAAEAHR